jgi:hypothetical protein
MFVLIGPAQAQPACATEAQRKIEIEKLDKSIDWFLSIVEEVPEGIARQFRDAADDWRRDDRALSQAITHPLWAAHVIREAGADIKRKLRPTHDTPVLHLKAAISALGEDASFRGYLSDYEARDRGRGHGRRIVNTDDWIRRYHLLSFDLRRYAQCLVDLVSLGGGSSSPAAPR